MTHSSLTQRNMTIEARFHYVHFAQSIFSKKNHHFFRNTHTLIQRVIFFACERLGFISSSFLSTEKTPLETPLFDEKNGSCTCGETAQVSPHTDLPDVSIFLCIIETHTIPLSFYSLFFSLLFSCFEVIFHCFLSVVPVFSLAFYFR